MGYEYINIYYSVVYYITLKVQIENLVKFSDKGIYIRRGRDPRTGGRWGWGWGTMYDKKNYRHTLSCLDDLPLPQEHR